MSLPPLLVLIPLHSEQLAELRPHFDVVYRPGHQPVPEGWGAEGERARFVLTNGARGLSAAELAHLPNVELVCALGAGYENLDLAAMRARQIAAVNGAGANAATVADQGFALLLAAVRRIPEYDAACRKGVWRDALPMQPGVSGKKMGIVGLGAVGRQFARRAEGFDMQIGYRNRNPRNDLPAHYRYFDSVLALAQWADYLVVTAPGGEASHHLVDAQVLRALGKDGFLVNVGRGSVVDTAALANALRAGVIAGAGLDVYEGEPSPPQALIDLPNVVLSPHVAGRSPEAEAATLAMFLENTRRHQAGEALLTPL
ncbi:2-hydroxyacid dehydrogenase [Pandoraea nosoerga]|uniref:2-ketogluconate reductase n=1 Tax=Pandoraea nosoerga TaxID=2508296 RepID=A0A5E4RJ01_9BURK|nr:2-hydroxyacid dehydrogenase [Pandoraea nosoerga]MBN4664473.1 2-hydroxyacid dehydrogenase [Pandoraea nosoerga]MBN4674491.1 2-hydroxyacid dehydrogenase [Pandoraea nosoerga]MBN4679759.1 2-hydroxyacid dehydrogenase [Pandoraea nosoerga]MBN4743153.1 2-hydroxyacid dehydrogenase [Pandoraea nosoerga]VVD63105.1 2-ketogluconate reductase [Pandoraea nosoerga]